MTSKQDIRIREKIILVALLAVFVSVAGFSAYKIITISKDYRTSKIEYEALQKQFVKKTETAVEDKQEEEEAGLFSVDFNALKQKNKDYIGWIIVPGTSISYPVLQAKDNDKYLHRTMEGKYAYAGSIFMDFRVSGLWDDFHTILYGHNMKNKTMFHDMRYYVKKDYWDKHQTIEIYLKDKIYVYKAFSFYKTIATDDSYTLYYSNDQAKSDYIRYCQSSSKYNSKQSVNISDKIITLSTCSDSSGDGRYVLHAVLTEVIDLNGEIQQ